MTAIRRGTFLPRDLGMTARTVPDPILLSRTLLEMTIHRALGLININTSPVIPNNSSVNNGPYITPKTLLSPNSHTNIHVIDPVTMNVLWLPHLTHRTLTLHKTTLPLLLTPFCVKTWPLTHVSIVANRAIGGNNALKPRTRTRPRSMPFKPGIKIPLLIVSLLIIDLTVTIINIVLVSSHCLLKIKRKSKVTIQSRATPMPPIRQKTRARGKEADKFHAF